MMFTLCSKAVKSNLPGTPARRSPIDLTASRKERAFVDGLANVPNATLSAHSCSVRVRKAFANCGHWLAQWQFTGIGSKRSSDRISRKFLADATTVKMDKFNSTLTLTAPSMSI
jgi:hypothetical protein